MNRNYSLKCGIFLNGGAFYRITSKKLYLIFMKYANRTAVH